MTRAIFWLLGGAAVVWHLIGSVNISFRPVYMIVQLPNECTAGSVFAHQTPPIETTIEEFMQ